MKAARGNANDGERSAGHADGSSKNISLTAKATLPVVIADHDFRVGAGSGRRIRIEKVANHRLHAQNREIVLAHQASFHFLGAASDPQIERFELGLRSEHPGHDSSMVAKVGILGKAEKGARTTAVHADGDAGRI